MWTTRHLLPFDARGGIDSSAFSQSRGKREEKSVRRWAQQREFLGRRLARLFFNRDFSTKKLRALPQTQPLPSLSSSAPANLPRQTTPTGNCPRRLAPAVVGPPPRLGAVRRPGRRRQAGRPEDDRRRRRGVGLRAPDFEERAREAAVGLPGGGAARRRARRAEGFEGYAFFIGSRRTR